MTTQLTEAEINALKLKADKYERRLVYNNQKVKEYNVILKAQDKEAYLKQKMEQVMRHYEAHKEEISIKRKQVYQQKKQARLLLLAQTNIQEQTNIQV